MNRYTLKHGFFGLVVAVGLAFLIISPADSATYYVRLDGGTATQCTGLADAPYLGSGKNQPCAFSHPFWVITPKDQSSTKLQGGDTLIIDGSNNAQYKMGWNAPNTTSCNASWSYDCYMKAVPSGPDPLHPTRILGKGWDTGCSNPPELWGTQRAIMVVNLRNSNNIEMQCLNITDRSGCVEFHPEIGCIRDGQAPSLGDWASTGIEAADSSNVLLKNVKVHGLGHTGIHAGRLKDWTIDMTEIVGNGWVGWDGDIGANQSSNSGTMTFNKVRIEWNGCGETYPQKQPQGCWSQSQGGYGDGLGTHLTGANWVFNECNISHNTSDGLDLLYHDGNGIITIKRSRFEGNAGNQVKTGTGTTIDNSIIIGNCAYFNNQPFTSTRSPGFDNCRAQGNAIGFSPKPGHSFGIYNSTVTSNGDCLVLSGASFCDGSETLTARNTIFSAGTDFQQPFENSCLYWAGGTSGNGDGPCGQLKLNEDYSLIWNVKSNQTVCKNKGTHSICADPKFQETSTGFYSGSGYNAYLKNDSPAKDAALVLTGKSSLDYNGYDRGSTWDIGALEYGSVRGETTQTLTCADGIQYCTTQTACEGQSYFWYNNTCNAQPKPLTCVDGIQYCTTQTDCVNNGHYWYNNVCNAQPKPLTCADGIQYCLTQTDCTSNGHYWYNNTCNAQPKPLTCVDGIQYCTTRATCEGQNYFWYNNTCNAQPKPLTCVDGIQHCSTQTDCVNNGHYWYNNTCNAQPQPKTCADGIQYCTTKIACEGQSYFWYNNTCNAQPKPLTCTDGIQYCSTKSECEGRGYYWYANSCNLEPKVQPTPQSQPKQESLPLNSPTLFSGPDNNLALTPQSQPKQESLPLNSPSLPSGPDNNLALTPGPISDNNSTANISTGSSDVKVGSTEPSSSQPVSLTSNSGNESKNTGTGVSGDVKAKSVEPSSSQPVFLTSSSGGGTQNTRTGSSGGGGRGGGGRGGGGKSSGGSSGGGTSLIGAGAGAGVPINVFDTPSPVKSTALPGELSSNLIKGAPQATPSRSAKGVVPTIDAQPIKGESPTTASQPAPVNKTDAALITPSLHLTDNTSISLTRDDIAAQAEVASEPTVKSDKNQPDENVNLTKTESETPLDKTIIRITGLWRKMLRWFLGG
ncbi:MAG: right-handed parallel beta-helix repeat-containing protein [Candidatus Omnitrophica bacterium]|nr:right-handed parallel beta-helix repeat-containing protein [Candidatus Omnitrophota bacterium]